MSLALGSRTIQRVRLIDDDAKTRAMYRYSVEDLGLDADDVQGPIGNFQDFIRQFSFDRDAAICDFHLKTSNYSTRDGDELVTLLYQNKIPVVLCTRWANELPDSIRHRRRQIPVVLPPTELTPDSITDAFRLCVNEFSGTFSQERKPWRALVRIESAEEVGAGHYRFSVVIPGWSSDVGLTFDVPATESKVFPIIHKRVVAGEIVRVFGQVNLGAVRKEDIYIDNWSFK
jgi:hypothetical protein